MKLAGMAALGSCPILTRAETKHEEAADLDVGRHVYKSLKWDMIKEPGSTLEKFKLLKDVGFDGVELDSPSLTLSRRNPGLRSYEFPGLMTDLGRIASVGGRSLIAAARSDAAMIAIDRWARSTVANSLKFRATRYSVPPIDSG